MLTKPARSPFDMIAAGKIAPMKKLLIPVFLACLAATGTAQTTLDTALNFSVKDTYGVTRDLFNILNDGKIVVIDFFSTG